MTEESAVKRSCLEEMYTDMVNMLGDRQTTDLSLLCGGEELRVHSFILRARSPVFYAMMTTDMVEKKMRVVNILDTKMSVLREMIKYMYTAEVSAGYANFEDLLILANKYQVRSLVSLACRLLSTTRMSPDTALQLGIFGETHAAEDLVWSAASFIASNLSSLGQGETSEWMEAAKNSPVLTARIVEVMRVGRQRKLVVDRFTGLARGSYGIIGKKDAIQFRLDWEGVDTAPTLPLQPSTPVKTHSKRKLIEENIGRKKTKLEVGERRPLDLIMTGFPLFLTGLGLYAPAQVGETISVELSLLVLLDNSVNLLTRFTMKVVSLGEGEVVEVDLPLPVNIQSGTEYIVVQEISGNGFITTGLGGKESVEITIPDCPARAKVTFSTTPISTNLSNVRRGLLPRLLFKTHV